MSHDLREIRQKQNIQELSSGRKEHVAYRRRAASPIRTSGGLQTTTVYETPWDQQTPDVNTLSFNTLSPLPEHYKQHYEPGDAQPLLGYQESPAFPASADSKTTLFTPTNGKRRGSDNDVFEEFGPVPNTGNSLHFNLSNSGPHAQGSDWIAAKHPFWPDTFEAIHWPPLIFLTIVVVSTYPLLFLSAFVAKERTLFWTRFIVGAAASLIGFALGLALMRIGKRTLEAATWATFIHRSLDGRGGLTLGDLDTKSTYPNFTSLGFTLFIERNISRIFWRGSRPYDKKPWSLFVLVFTFLSIIAASTSFFLGRLVDISTANRAQGNLYREVSVIGDVSPSDIENAKVQLAATESFVQTWTISAFGSGGQIPVPVKLRYQGAPVYFAEISNHLLPGGLGLGSFQQNQDVEDDDDTPALFPSNPTSVNDVPVGSVVRYSRWGLRIQCAKLPNPVQNIVPMSLGNMTYAYVPRDTITSLMSGLGVQDVPFSWNGTFLHQGDHVPSGIDMGTIGLVSSWNNNGVAQSFTSYTIDEGKDGKGWVVFEMVMMRLNTTYTPNGSFPVYSEDRKLGYDAAVCIEVIEPFVVDSYNSTIGKAQSFRVIGKGGLSTLNFDYGGRDGNQLDGLNKTLTSVGKFSAYAVGHDNSRNQILKDNGRDRWWVPNPTAISWTDGIGPKNYTLLSAERLQASLGKADAAQFLPYLTGSQPVIAYQYTEDAVAYAKVLPVPTILTLLVVLMLGYLSAFLVPRLPLGVARRDFSLFTWIAAFEGDGILHSVVKHHSLRPNMDLEEVQKQLAERKVRYST